MDDVAASKIVRIHSGAKSLDLRHQASGPGVVVAQRLVEAVIPAALHQGPDQALGRALSGTFLPEPEPPAVQLEQLVHQPGRQVVDRVPGHEGLQDEQVPRGLDGALPWHGPARFDPQTFGQFHALAPQRLRLGVRLPFEDHPFPIGNTAHLVRSGLPTAETAHQLVRLTRCLLQ